MHLRGKRWKKLSVRRLWQQSRKEVTQAVIRRQKEMDSRKNVGGKLAGFGDYLDLWSEKEAGD